jgi:hypothetical protein
MSRQPVDLTSPVHDERRRELRRIYLAMPEATVEEGQHLTFRVRGRTFAYHLFDHHGDGVVALNCKVDSGANHVLANEDPARYSIPPYLGHHGWVALRPDLPDIDWAEIEDLMADSYCLVAPSRLAHLVAARGD